MNKIRKGDEVIVIAGRDKGKRGTVSVKADNEAIFNAATGKADRVAIKQLDNGTKVRVYKSSGEEIKVA